MLIRPFSEIHRRKFAYVIWPVNLNFLALLPHYSHITDTSKSSQRLGLSVCVDTEKLLVLHVCLLSMHVCVCVAAQ